MNYLAHGHRHLDDPWFVAGTALPDWLAASDRRSRLRPERIRDDGPLARGVQQHVEDDAWFHATEAFQRSEVELTALVKSVHADEPRQRSWFFGHILVELLLDAWLMEQDSTLLDRYFDALDEVAADRVVSQAEPWLTQPPSRLHAFIDLFRTHRFLDGYRTDEGLLARLNGVAGRVGLPTLVPATLPLLSEARRLVYDRAPELLTR
ncbi:MAG: hypothetical protein AAGD14_12145 [Planctomycetota bacterium]